MGSSGVRAVAAAGVALLLAGAVIGALALAGPALPSSPVHKHFVPAVAGVSDSTISTAPAGQPASQVTAPATAPSEGTTTTTSPNTTTTQPQPAIGGPAHGVCTDPSGFCYGP
jgi:hypothetical protein